MNLLLIDDDSLSLETLAKSLLLFGYKVELFTNPVAAIKQFLLGLEVDLIITDFSMPELDGLKVIKKIREINADVPVIVISAVGRHEHRLDEIVKEADSFLQKPIDIYTLLDSILELVPEKGTKQ